MLSDCVLSVLALTLFFFFSFFQETPPPANIYPASHLLVLCLSYCPSAVYSWAPITPIKSLREFKIVYQNYVLVSLSTLLNLKFSKPGNMTWLSFNIE